MYVFMVAPCTFCGNLFSFNPSLVPSIRRTPDGPREPLCFSCHARAQQLRKEKGLPPWPDPLPGSYEAAPEESINWGGDE